VQVEAPHTISVIDDEETVRRATSSLLRSLGHEVRAFVSAEAFLDSDYAATCSCIVCDVQMEGMSGIDLFLLLRSRKVDLPFIFITAFSEQTVRLRIDGDICVLQKPFQAEALVSCIDRALSQTS
jgi:FixJ family two-component response regulator